MRARTKIWAGLFAFVAWLCLLGICWYFISGWMDRRGITELANTVEQAANAIMGGIPWSFSQRSITSR